jgi:hypothetical protein
MAKKKWFYIVASLVIAFIAYSIWAYIGVAKLSNNMTECGLDGPNCAVNEISIDLDTIEFDSKLEFENGNFGFINSQNSSIPIIVNINEQGELKWAYQLGNERDSCSGIAFYKLSGISLRFINKKPQIFFFNQSHSEPGTIYLDENYNFKSLCLSMF